MKGNQYVTRVCLVTRFENYLFSKQNRYVRMNVMHVHLNQETSEGFEMQPNPHE